MTAVEETHPLPAGSEELLAGRVVYLAHPIDFERLNNYQREQMYSIAKALHDAGAVVFDPAAAFNVSPSVRPNAMVARINRAAILAADAMVACWPESPGVGVAMEIQLADQIGMPTLVLTLAANQSWSLAGLEHAISVRMVDRDRDLRWLAEEAAEYAAVRGTAPAADPLPLYVQANDPRWVPNRGHHDDAAFDLYVAEETKIEAGAIADVPAGCAVEFPDNVWGLILGRSSTSRSHRLLVHPGVIDTGYRGPLFVQVENLNDEDFVATEGMRLGQLIPLPNFAARMAPMPTVMLRPSVRGDKGFGSTGA